MLLGAQKAATTSVFQLLQDAGMVCGASNTFNPNGIEKESHFWDMPDDKFPYGKNPAGKFIAQYKGHSCTHFLDASPNYLFSRMAVFRMASSMPDTWRTTVRMLMILREPVSRDLSLFNMMKEDWSRNKGQQETAEGPIWMNLCMKATRTHFPSYGQACACKIRDWNTRCLGHSSDELVAYEYCADYNANPTQTKRFGLDTADDPPNRLTDSMYYPQVQAYIQRFDRKRVMIVEFDHLVRDQKRHIKNIVEFYGLPYTNHQNQLTSLPDDNTQDFAGKVKSISCKTRKQLETLFTPINNRLHAYVTQSQEMGQAPPQEISASESGIGKVWAPPPCTGEEMVVMADGKSLGAAEATDAAAGASSASAGGASTLLPPQ
jgi:hypothetical protein